MKTLVRVGDRSTKGEKLNVIKRFWRQPNRRYRNFQIVYAILTLNFLIPAVSYYVDSGAAMDNFYGIGEALGSHGRPATEDSYIWWILGAGNVATLGLMCLMMQVNLRYFFPILPALVTLKGLSSLGFLAVFSFGPYNWTFFAAFLLDGVTVAVMLYFAIGAKRSIDRDSSGLVPEPWSTKSMSRLSDGEREKASSVAAALVPDGAAPNVPGAARVDEVVPAFQEQLKAAPLAAALGLRVSLHLIDAAPILYVRRFRTLGRLSDTERSRYLASLEHSRIYLVRQLFTALKASLLLAYGSSAEVRRGLGAYQGSA